MKAADLAIRLAHVVAGATWTEAAIAEALRRHLPPRVRHHAKGLAKAACLARPDAKAAPPPRCLAEALRDNARFDALMRHGRRTGEWPEPDLSEPRMAPLSAFETLDLPQIPRVGDLAAWLVMPPDRLDYFADTRGRAEACGATPVNHYRYRLIPKRAGAVRLIEAPKSGLKGLQRRILRGILDQVPVHRDAFGFVRGRGVLEAAARHAGEAVVVRFDLADFFPSVGRGRVYGIFRALGYPHGVAWLLAGLTTTTTPSWIMERLAHPDRQILRAAHLPQGAPTSPALANLVAFGLDRRLEGLAQWLGAAWSRYADDITFSGDREIVAPLLDTVPRIVRDEGFRLNAAKTRVMRAGRRQVVTGVVVNRHLNLSRTEFDRLKAVIHRAGKADDHRLRDPRFRAVLHGKIGWAERVNPGRGAKLRAMLEAAEAGRPGAG